ncbi:MAG: 3-carboxy-cis,cis-muconate cycloisomerase [Rhizobiaceae bacterium]|nr:3-carboxy-cis,cis-muconate cycloisomerase [Rhizobiaceae bacterium]
MSACAFDHPFLSGLLGDDESARYFSAEADIAAMVAFEVALAEAEADLGVIPGDAARSIAIAAGKFKPDLQALRTETARDGVSATELVRQLRSATGEPNGRFVHFGATSQDAIDTSLSLRLVPVLDLLSARLGRLVAALDDMEKRHGGKTVMAHTRMQAAIAVPAARKIASWRDPLVRHRQRLDGVKDAIAVVTFGGAAGTLDKLGGNAQAVTESLARRLKLKAPERPRHSERDGVVAVASTLAGITGSLGKFGSDVTLAAQNEVGEIILATGGGSSAMAHKVNPVGAEILVTLARFNATLVSGMHQSMVHENERSGAAWTLEWMLLPQIAIAAGAATRTALDLIPAIGFSTK